MMQLVNHSFSTTIRAACVLALAAHGLVAQQVPQQRQQNAPAGQGGAAKEEAPETGEIRGTVRSVAGDPIPRASLRLTPTPTAATFTAILGGANTYSATADEAGNFVILNIPPARGYHLMAERPGFVSQEYGARVPRTPGTPLNVNPGQVIEDVAITMTPQAVITGQVLDQNGDPLQGVQVQAQRYVYSRGQRLLSSNAAAATDDLGEYRISGLPAGRYYLRAEQRNVASILGGQVATSVDGGPVMGNVPTFYPNADEMRLATPITVRAGDQQQGMDIRMVKVPVFSISGKIATDQPFTLLPLRAMKEGEQDLIAALTTGQQILRPGQDEFRFGGLTPGTYRIESVAAGRINGQSIGGGVGSLVVTIRDKDVTDQVLVLGPGLTVNGSVQLEDGEVDSLIPEGATAGSDTLAILGGGLVFTLTESSAGGLPISGSTAGLEKGGVVKFENLFPRKYTMQTTNTPDGLFVKSVRFNGQDVTHSAMDLTSGAGGQLDIVLSKKAGSVTGVVQNEDGAATPGMQVTLWPKSQDEDRIAREAKTAVTDQNGGFQINGLAPGEYYVSAWDTTEQGLSQAPTFIQQFRSNAQELEISEGGAQAVAVELNDGAAVAAALEKMP